MTTKGSSTKPKNIKECVYVLQDVAQNLSNCVQNLNSKRIDPNKCDLNQDNNQTKMMYRTMMGPQDWDHLLKKDKKMKNSSGRQDNCMDNTYENDFKNLSNQLASTRKPMPFDYEDCTNNTYMSYSSKDYDNMLKKSRSATAMHVGLNAVQMTGYDRTSPPYTNSYLNSQQQQQQFNKSSKAKCPVDNRTMVYPKNPLCDPCGRICQPKKPPCPPMYQSTPYKSSNPYGNYETSTNYNAVDPNYYSNSKTYASNQYASDSKSYNNNCNDTSNPYLELEDLIIEIEDILQKTKNCAGQKANHDKQKCGHKEHNSKCQCCCKKKEKKKSEDSSGGVNYLICKFDKFVANQKTQIQQFENMIECLKNSDFSKQSEFGSETSCKEDTINNLWAERLNEIIDIIIEGFGNVIKTMVQVNDSTGKDPNSLEDDCIPNSSEDKEAAMNNKLRALQLNIIETLQNIIDTLEKCVPSNEDEGIKAGEETKGNESKRSSKISIPESKVETEIEGNQGIISNGPNIQLDE